MTPPQVWEIQARIIIAAEAWRKKQPDRAWQALSLMEPAGYHFEFAALAILALARGLTLQGRVDSHPACAQVKAITGSPVEAAWDEDGCFIRVNGVPWARGDAFDMGREFYALVGFNQAPAAAWDALIAQVGEDRASEIVETFCRDEFIVNAR